MLTVAEKNKRADGNLLSTIWAALTSFTPRRLFPRYVVCSFVCDIFQHVSSQSGLSVRHQSHRNIRLLLRSSAYITSILGFMFYAHVPTMVGCLCMHVTLGTVVGFQWAAGLLARLEAS